MTDSEILRMLEDWARKVIEASKFTVERGDSVLPAILTINGDEEIEIAGLIFKNRDERKEMVERIIRDNDANAYCMFGDTNIRNITTHEITGSCLTAVCELKSGAMRVVSCRYDTQPTLHFHQIEVSDKVDWHSINPFNRKQVTH